jgi:nucleotide-binding universal stress UspA family protein
MPISNNFLPKSILVVVDPVHDNGPLFERAAWLAQQYEGDLTLFSSDYDHLLLSSYLVDDFILPSVMHAYEESLSAHLDSAAKPLREKGLRVKTHSEWAAGSLEYSIKNYLTTHNADLILKQATHHPKLETLLFAPDDWMLIRQAPKPILYSYQTPIAGNVVAAIDVNPSNTDHNITILQHADQYAAQLNSPLTVLTCYKHSLLESISALTDLIQQHDKDTLCQRHKSAIDALIQQAQVSPAQIEVLEGAPQHAITRYMQESASQTLVVGATEQHIIHHHTTEKLLEAVCCDLLVIPSPQEKE